MIDFSLTAAGSNKNVFLSRTTKIKYVEANLHDSQKQSFIQPNVLKYSRRVFIWVVGHVKAAHQAAATAQAHYGQS